MQDHTSTSITYREQQANTGNARCTPDAHQMRNMTVMGHVGLDFHSTSTWILASFVCFVWSDDKSWLWSSTRGMEVKFCIAKTMQTPINNMKIGQPHTHIYIYIIYIYIISSECSLSIYWFFDVFWTSDPFGANCWHRLWYLHLILPAPDAELRLHGLQRWSKSNMIHIWFIWFTIAVGFCLSNLFYIGGCHKSI